MRIRIFTLLFFAASICSAQTKPTANLSDGRNNKKSRVSSSQAVQPQHSSLLDACPDKEDFSYTIDLCNPMSISFQSSVSSFVSRKWVFDDGSTDAGGSPAHVFSMAGNHLVTMITDKGICSDTVNKVIAIKVLPADIVLTNDTTICQGAAITLRAQPALGHCWSPTKYLSNPNNEDPVSTPLENMTYYYTAQLESNNLIVNGDFSQGNSGFSSDYAYANPNTTEGQYFVGPNANAWNPNMSDCLLHTQANAYMMLVNGSPTAGVDVWKETIAVVPNTNYVFSTWIAALWPPNPAQLQFSFNGNPVGNLITASLPTCTWSQFYTTWNSGNNASVVISIVNQNTEIQGNDFALSDMSFAAVTVETDSVVIKIDTASIKTNNDATVCSGTPIQMNTIGAGTSFSWQPAGGLSDPNIPNPIATPTESTRYIVSGITKAGCTAKDTVDITINPLPAIVRTSDTTICHDKSLELQASGGVIYSWLPSPTLSATNIPNPVASPLANTTYYLTVTDNAGCTNKDSITVAVKQIPVFDVSPGQTVCKGSPAQLTAAGGDLYSWTPAAGLNNPHIANPVAIASEVSQYTVKIIESTCKDSASLTTSLTVLALPEAKATSSNDVDCSMPISHLHASGGSSYVWQPAASLDNATSATPVATPATSTVYLLKAIDMNGCVSYDSVAVLVTRTGDLLVNLPNAFTPNGDGRNDCFGITRYAGLLQNVHFSVFDRFGDRLFYTTNPMNCWDGRFKGQLQDSGGYVYVLEANTFCGEVFKKGVVMLLR